MITIRCKIEPSINKKEKSNIYIWVSPEERKDKEVIDKIKSYEDAHQVTIFVSGTESVEKFIHDFITYSNLKY